MTDLLLLQGALRLVLAVALQKRNPNVGLGGKVGHVSVLVCLC